MLPDRRPGPADRARRRPRRRARAAAAPRARARSHLRHPRRACAAGCRRCRAARRPRDRRARRGSEPPGASCWCRSSRPRQAQRAPRRRRSRRARSARAGIATSSRPSTGSVGTSLAEWTATSIRPSSSARSSSETHLDLSLTLSPRSPDVVIVTISASGPSSRATDSACASASALPRVPIRIKSAGWCGRARCVAAREPRPAAAVRRRRAPAPRRSRPNRSRTSAIRAWTRSSRISRICTVGSCSRRLTIALATASTRSRSRGEAVSHLPSFSSDHLLGYVICVRAERRHRRQHLERSEPGRELLDLLLDDPLGLARLRLADAAVAVGDRLEVVDVGERHARQLRAGRVDVTRDREVDQQHRPPAPVAHHGGDVVDLEQQVRRRGRGDDDVGLQQRIGELVEAQRGAAVAAREAQRAIAPAVRHEHRAGAAGGTAPGRRARWSRRCR